MPFKSIAEIRNANKNIRDQAVLMRFLRPVAPFIAWGALRLRLSPFHINFLTFSLGIFICFAFAGFGPEWRLVSVFLLVLWQMLDVTDGTMARALEIRSNYGGFIDYLGGIFLLSFLPLSLGMGLYRYPEHSAQFLFSQVSIPTNLKYHPNGSMILSIRSWEYTELL